jgi:hypothetical protein
MPEGKRVRRKGPPAKGYLREWRLHMGYMSQGDLAKATKELTRATICRLETGSIPYRKKHLLILAKVLKCTPGQILDENPQETKTLNQLFRVLTEEQRHQLLRIAREMKEGN